VEFRIPAGIQGSFIPVGNAFDAIRALSDILKRASSDVFIVDPYMDECALIDVAVLSEESVPVRLLSDTATVKPSFKPAVNAWKSQYQSTRPLEARLAAAKTLHDRLIITDRSVVWVLTQSLKDLAKRSPATLTAVPAEAAALKIPAYEAIWSAATSV